MRLSTFALAALLAAGLVSPEAVMPVHAEQPAAQRSTCTLRISGMTCAGCVIAVRIAAKKIDGVIAVTASHARRQAEVTFDPAKTNPRAIASRISATTGFTTEPTGEPRR